ncbi:isochorismate synthase [Marisediminicola senii]|uniref:isochorismate synthase n=1 Tax=Marisediminicola senii TaxID=2711233 RepID=UPI0013EC4CB0|nr:isochorismate synthase [Marisediminicola senii]
MPSEQRSVPALTVTTSACTDLGPLIPLVDPGSPLVWMRRGFGMIGIGEALRLEFTGPNRIADAAAAWQRVVACASVTDDVGVSGTGLVAFGSFAFAEGSTMTSVLIVPSMLVGRSPQGSWVTRVTVDDPGVSAHDAPPAPLPEVVPFGEPASVDLLPGTLSREAYFAAVGTAVAHIRRHELEKVVLARDAVGRLPEGFDIRGVIRELARGYPDCWTFAIDGFLGSSPETLVSVMAGTVTARVLAGSAARGTDAASDETASTALATSSKDLDEHQFAVQNVLASLRPHSPSVMASELPFTLKLPNLWHLASDVDGELTDGSTSLDLVGSMHPTAAVAGTPTALALSLIGELEPFDRGRYAGPVGWVDAAGDGEWAVALRSAQVSADGTVTAYAGAGIVADSAPERELVETRLKFRPIVEAFRGQ